MGYHEIRLDSAQQLIIKPGDGFNTEFDVDYFGQDDGAETDPNVAFRLLFQLGASYMIYLYVVGTSPQPRAPLPFFHTFWIKDCAVAEVEMKELGAPAAVDGVLSLPAIYKRVSLIDNANNEKLFVVDSGRFFANSKLFAGNFVEMRWNLYSLKDGKLSTLFWSNKDGWRFGRDGKTRALSTEERVLFSSPVGL